MKFSFLMMIPSNLSRLIVFTAYWPHLSLLSPLLQPPPHWIPRNPFKTFTQAWAWALRKRCLMHVRSVVPDWPVLSANAYQGWHFTLSLYHSFKRSPFLPKNRFRRKVSSLVNLCGHHRLIWDDILRTCIKADFLRARLIYTIIYVYVSSKVFPVLQDIHSK